MAAISLKIIYTRYTSCQKVMIHRVGKKEIISEYDRKVHPQREIAIGKFDYHISQLSLAHRLLPNPVIMSPGK